MLCYVIYLNLLLSYHNNNVNKVIYTFQQMFISSVLCFRKYSLLNIGIIIERLLGLQIFTILHHHGKNL